MLSFSAVFDRKGKTPVSIFITTICVSHGALHTKQKATGKMSMAFCA